VAGALEVSGKCDDVGSDHAPVGVEVLGRLHMRRTISAAVEPAAHAVLIMDNVGGD